MEITTMPACGLGSRAYYLRPLASLLNTAAMPAHGLGACDNMSGVAMPAHGLGSRAYYNPCDARVWAWITRLFNRLQRALDFSNVRMPVHGLDTCNRVTCNNACAEASYLHDCPGRFVPAQGLCVCAVTPSSGPLQHCDQLRRPATMPAHGLGTCGPQAVELCLSQGLCVCDFSQNPTWSLK